MVVGGSPATEENQDAQPCQQREWDALSLAPLCPQASLSSQASLSAQASLSSLSSQAYASSDSSNASSWSMTVVGFVCDYGIPAALILAALAVYFDLFHLSWRAPRPHSHHTAARATEPVGCMAVFR